MSLSINEDGSVLSVKDITEYGDPLKENVALIVGWSKDDFNADTNIDFTNPDPGQWEEMITNGHTFNVFMTACNVYSATLDADIPYQGIIYDRGMFYIRFANSTVHPSNESSDLLWPAEDKSCYAPLKVGITVTFGIRNTTFTIEQIRQFIIVNGKSLGTVTGIVVSDATTCFLEKLYCHVWRVRNNSPMSIVLVNLLDYKRTTLVSYQGADEVSLDIEPFGDGFYIVQVVYDDSFIEYAFLDFCDAYNCYEGLFKYSLCGSEDPCSAGSDCDDKTRVIKQDMNAIREIITTITLMAKFNLSQQMGIFGVLDSYDDFIIKVGMLIEKLKVITDRCGVCNGETLNTNC